MNNKIGEKIKFYRQLNKLSRQELADKLEVSVHTLAKYEQGQREANYDTLIKICSILNINVYELFDEQKISDDFYKSIYNSLQQLDDTKNVIEFLFLHNNYLNLKLESSASCSKDKDYFFTIVSDFIDSELEDLNLLNMPTIVEDDNA